MWSLTLDNLCSLVSSSFCCSAMQTSSENARDLNSPNILQEMIMSSGGLSQYDLRPVALLLHLVLYPERHFICDPCASTELRLLSPPILTRLITVRRPTGRDSIETQPRFDRDFGRIAIRFRLDHDRILAGLRLDFGRFGVGILRDSGRNRSRNRIGFWSNYGRNHTMIWPDTASYRIASRF